MTNLKHLIQTNLAALAVIAACGCTNTGSGLDGDQRLVSLSSDDLTTECSYIAAVYPARTVSCSATDDETRGLLETVPECVSGLQTTLAMIPSCDLTVSQFEACFEALAHEPDCTIATSDPPECAPLATPQCTPPGKPSMPDLRIAITARSASLP